MESFVPAVRRTPFFMKGSEMDHVKKLQITELIDDIDQIKCQSRIPLSDENIIEIFRVLEMRKQTGEFIEIKNIMDKALTGIAEQIGGELTVNINSK